MWEGSDKGRIREVYDTVNYLRPGRSSLMSRGLFTMLDVAAVGLRRNDPTAHERQAKEGYIKGVAANRPAVTLRIRTAKQAHPLHQGKTVTGLLTWQRDT